MNKICVSEGLCSLICASLCEFVQVRASLCKSVRVCASLVISELNRPGKVTGKKWIVVPRVAGLAVKNPQKSAFYKLFARS